MIPALLRAVATARGLSPRKWHRAKNLGHPDLPYCFHGTGERDELILLTRTYKPVGTRFAINPDHGWADYASSQFAHLRCADTTRLRQFATNVERGRSSFPGGHSVAILYFIKDADSCAQYVQRLLNVVVFLQGEKNGT